MTSTARQAARLRLVLLAFLIFWGGTTGVCSALESTSFYSRNQSPFLLVSGIPALEDGLLAKQGGIDFRLTLEAINNFSVHANASEKIILDGETYRTLCALRYGLGGNWDAGLEIPYLRHTGGGLDSFINGWHDLTGLPDGGRPSRARNLLEYRYEGNGRKYLLNRNADGVGDLTFHLGYQWLTPSETQPKSIVFRAGIKAPTGESDQLLGSGSWDAFALVSGREMFSLAGHKASVFGALGALGSGSGDVLEEIRRDLTGFGNLGCSVFVWQPLELKVQLDFHSAVYRSNLDELGAVAAQLNAGGSIYLGESSSIDIMLSEDILVNTAPDVVFQVGWRQSF